MNIANVTSRFAALSGFDSSELCRWHTLIEDSCAFVGSKCIKSELDENDTKRLEMLCAVYALKMSGLCNDENITSFTAGDVKITSSDSKDKYDKMWRELVSKSSDLIVNDGFLFGRVI
ncbi:MAG: hypothetical protein Q4A46_05795 [Clostridia bacterium]|nr:hypothetical protein [Clostridia bacterium]DAU20913.1 MAG TPA: hypothetical protein [Caudoviricetes sp.]